MNLSNAQIEANTIEEKANSLTLEITGVRKELVNSLRRICMAEVPTLAIDEVLFIENTSSVYNEYISHRLGLLPLKTAGDPEFLAQLSVDIQSGAAPSVRVDYQLRQECPVETEGQFMVYSSELKSVSGDGSTGPVSETTPLFKLGAGQQVEFQAFAKYGIGLQHAKFSPTSPVSYAYKPVLQFDSKKQFNCEEHVSVCPTKCLEYKDGELKFTDPWKCILCKECEKDCRTGATKISWDESVVRFTLESTGSLQPRTIFRTAIAIMKKKLRSFSEEIEKRKMMEATKV